MRRARTPPRNTRPQTRNASSVLSHQCSAFDLGARQRRRRRATQAIRVNISLDHWRLEGRVVRNCDRHKSGAVVPMKVMFHDNDRHTVHGPAGMIGARAMRLGSIVGGAAFLLACAMSGCAGSGDTSGTAGASGTAGSTGGSSSSGHGGTTGGAGTGQAGSGQAGTGGGAAGTSGNAGSGAAGTSGGAGSGAAGTSGTAGPPARAPRGPAREGLSAAREARSPAGVEWVAVARRGPRAGAAAPGRAGRPGGSAGTGTAGRGGSAGTGIAGAGGGAGAGGIRGGDAQRRLRQDARR